MKQYEPKPYDAEAAKKYAESLKKILPFLNEAKKIMEEVQIKMKKVEAIQQMIAQHLKS